MKRIKRLLELMDSRGACCILVTDMSDIFYLTGFTGTTAYLFVSPEEIIFLTDGRYEEQVKQEIPSEITVRIVSNYSESLKALAVGRSALCVSQKCPLNVYSLMHCEASSVQIDTDDMIGSLRTVKDAEEIEEIQKAFKVAADAFLESLPGFRSGVKETEWAALLEYNMRKRGARDRSFETIVGSGPRGALPHGMASDKIVEAEEPVVVDFGAKLRYCSDITRMVYDGDDDKVHRVIEIVRGAVKAAFDVIKPGVKCSDVDYAAREYIAQAGYGHRFIHGLGHGVGIDVHELPVFNSRDETVLKEGMVITVEPGIYLPESFGVRLEDTVAVTENGCFNLTSVLDKYVYNTEPR
ncbi:M24 family metallopeptidase [Limisalsivibrio acetivorans]|uniref:M24 family metallopeptidase n=1 Tax=Limisalsivibrio acetivorans TaxID=1304888 RepID=UPI0003B66BD5|nr:Xaa-Pro peptidase family protein [Limisalsivibrio acetivorans]